MKEDCCLIDAAGCSPDAGSLWREKQSVVYTLEQENDGLKMTDTMKLEARGDSVDEDGRNYQYGYGGL